MQETLKFCEEFFSLLKYPTTWQPSESAVVMT